MPQNYRFHFYQVVSQRHRGPHGPRSPKCCHVHWRGRRPAETVVGRAQEAREGNNYKVEVPESATQGRRGRRNRRTLTAGQDRQKTMLAFATARSGSFPRGHGASRGLRAIDNACVSNQRGERSQEEPPTNACHAKSEAPDTPRAPTVLKVNANDNSLLIGRINT